MATSGPATAGRVVGGAAVGAGTVGTAVGSEVGMRDGRGVGLTCRECRESVCAMWLCVVAAQYALMGALLLAFCLVFLVL